MNSRERILAAIEHKSIDRIPTDIWATKEVWEKLKKHFGDGVNINEALGIDGFAGTGPKYTGPAMPTAPEGEKSNMWGIRTRTITYNTGAYEEMTFHPLAFAKTIDDLNTYTWPSADWFDYSEMKAKAAEGVKTHAVMCGYMAPFYYHNMLRGLEQSMIDPLESPDLTNEILNHISDFFYDHHRRMFEACEGLIDVAQVTDDLGSQNGPLISPKLYRNFYAPHHKRFINLCHEFGIKVFHHDDGSCRPFLKDLVEMGIDILNPIQWTCPGMDMIELKSEYGNKICFHGAVENQKILPFGTPEDVRKEVRHCIDSLASDKTGYILAPCHNLQSITPIENIIAMYDEARTYGKLS